MFKILTVFLGAILLGGCATHHMFDFTILSTKDFDIENIQKLSVSEVAVQGETEGVSMYLLIPDNLDREGEIELAVDGAISGIPGAVALIDGSLESLLQHP